MAIIQPNNFSNIPGPAGKSREVKSQEAGVPFHTEDGLVLSGGQLPPGVPDIGPASLPGPAEIPTHFPMEVSIPQESSARINIPQEFGGAFLSGVGSTRSGSEIGRFEFTNGLHSTKITSLSGRVLADASPFK